MAGVGVSLLPRPISASSPCAEEPAPRPTLLFLLAWEIRRGWQIAFLPRSPGEGPGSVWPSSPFVCRPPPPNRQLSPSSEGQELGRPRRPHGGVSGAVGGCRRVRTAPEVASWVWGASIRPCPVGLISLWTFLGGEGKRFPLEKLNTRWSFLKKTDQQGEDLPKFKRESFFFCFMGLRCLTCAELWGTAVRLCFGILTSLGFT